MTEKYIIEVLEKEIMLQDMYAKHMNVPKGQLSILLCEVLSLIKRQQTEIERLEKGSIIEAMTFNTKTISNVRTEAIKEFVVRLKSHAYYISFPKEHRVVDEDDIDNLVKEMENKDV